MSFIRNKGAPSIASGKVPDTIVRQVHFGEIACVQQEQRKREKRKEEKRSKKQESVGFVYSLGVDRYTSHESFSRHFVLVHTSHCDSTCRSVRIIHSICMSSMVSRV